MGMFVGGEKGDAKQCVRGNRWQCVTRRACHRKWPVIYIPTFFPDVIGFL